jgi:hypothetical protein
VDYLVLIKWSIKIVRLSYSFVITKSNSMNNPSKLLHVLAIGLIFPAMHLRAQQPSAKPALSSPNVSFSQKPVTVSNHYQSLTEIEFNKNDLVEILTLIISTLTVQAFISGISNVWRNCQWLFNNQCN